jgi:hypothetical protein
MSLILSSATNPGGATWSEGSGSATAQQVAILNADVSIAPTESTAYYATTSGSQVDVTLANPVFAGQVVSIRFVSDAGQDVVITFPAALNSAGNTIATLNDANDSFGVIAVAVGLTSFRWVPLFNNGAVLS